MGTRDDSPAAAGPCGLTAHPRGARAKLAQMYQITARRIQTVELGIPSFADTAGRTSTGRHEGPDRR